MIKALANLAYNFHGSREVGQLASLTGSSLHCGTRN